MGGNSFDAATFTAASADGNARAPEVLPEALTTAEGVVAGGPVTEADIVAAGADVAPRITPAHIEAQVFSELYLTGEEALAAGAYVGPGGPVDGIHEQSTTSLHCLTLCILVLKNGYTVVGKSACASPENFNLVIGQRIAREDAVRQVWALEGYYLRHKLAGTQYEGAKASPGL